MKRDAPQGGRQNTVPFTAPAPGRGACPVPGGPVGRRPCGSRSTAFSSSRMAFMSMLSTCFWAVSRSISALPCLRGDFLAAVLQFLQIPGRRVIEDQFPAVALLEQFPLLRLYPASCLWTALYSLYCAHISPRSVSVAIRRSAFDNPSPQVIVTGVHICDFFMELLHGLDAVCLHKAKQGGRSPAKPGFCRCGCQAA